MILFADSEGPDQTAQMHSLIWAFAVRIYPKTYSHGAAQIRVDPVQKDNYTKEVFPFLQGWSSVEKREPTVQLRGFSSEMDPFTLIYVWAWYSKDCLTGLATPGIFSAGF